MYVPFAKAFSQIPVEVPFYWASSEVSDLKLHILIGWKGRSTNARELITDLSMGHLDSLTGNGMAPECTKSSNSLLLLPELSTTDGYTYSNLQAVARK